MIRPTSTESSDVRQPNFFRPTISKRDGSIGPLLVIGVCLVLFLGGAGYYLFNRGDQAVTIEPIMAEVSRGEFVSQVLDQGEIQSSENIEIRCEAKARNGVLTVLRAVPEGTRVKEGDFLIQLDSTMYEKELEQQKILMANAETLKIQAETTLATAEAVLKEYEQGIFVEAEKTIANEKFDALSLITTAQQELKQAEAVYEHSKKLHAKAYITQQAMDAAEFAVQRAKINEEKGRNMKDLAEKKMGVLKEITSQKFILQYQSDIKAAKVNLASQSDAYTVEESKMAEIKSMTVKCLIKVPKGVSGQVVYGKESSRGGQDWGLEEGGTVRENQVLIRIPNPTKMEVKALINEQSITQIAVNMPVSVRVDALNNSTLKGVVTKVNQYAEQSGWMSSSVRKYAVFVRIVNPPENLKPGMNASVAIQTQFAADALVAPIQTVYGVQEKQFCLAKVGENQWKTLAVETAGANSQVVLFKSGVEVGDQLVMNPGAFKEYMDLPELKLDSKIELSDDELGTVGKTSEEISSARPGEAKAGGPPQQANGAPGGPPAGAGGRGPGGAGGMKLPASGAALIKSKDTDSDGKLTKTEAGSPYEFFFDSVDTDKDGFLSEAEADASIKSMKDRMQSGGGFGGAGGDSGPSGVSQ